MADQERQSAESEPPQGLGNAGEHAQEARAAIPVLSQKLPEVVAAGNRPLEDKRGKGPFCFQEFDAAYVERLRSRDPVTERHFVGYFGELIMMKLRRRLRSRALIEDVRQETLLRVFRALGRPEGLRNPERLGAFVNSVCNNVMREFLRAEGRRPPTVDEVDRATDPDPEASLISEEGQELVRRVIQRLPEKDQRVLRALFLEERDKDAICAEFGVDRDYLRVLLHRAKLHFRALYTKGR